MIDQQMASRCAAELLRVYNDENPNPDVEARDALQQHEPPLVDRGPLSSWLVTDEGMEIVTKLVATFEDHV